VTHAVEQVAAPRLAAGALFVDGDRVLLVHKTYGNGWDIPGGYVDSGESPAMACRREVREELGLSRDPLRLLVCDWAPTEREGDKILYVFHCGDLEPDAGHVHLDTAELDRWSWVPVEQLDMYVTPRLSRRLWHAYQAYQHGVPRYLEYGRPTLDSRPS
jgi:8-oxo-dGTP diphosphatase